MAWYNRIPLVGGFFDNPEQEALQQQFRDMAAAYQKAGEWQAKARQSQLGSQLSAMGPMQDYLSLLAPGLQKFDTAGMQGAFDQQTQGLTGGQGPAAAASPPKAPTQDQWNTAFEQAHTPYLKTFQSPGAAAAQKKPNPYGY